MGDGKLHPGGRGPQGHDRRVLRGNTSLSPDFQQALLQPIRLTLLVLKTVTPSLRSLLPSTVAPSLEEVKLAQQSLWISTAEKTATSRSRIDRILAACEPGDPVCFPHTPLLTGSMPHAWLRCPGA
jgi:hypothetical protein